MLSKEEMGTEESEVIENKIQFRLVQVFLLRPSHNSDFRCGSRLSSLFFFLSAVYSLRFQRLKTLPCAGHRAGENEAEKRKTEGGDVTKNEFEFKFVRVFSLRPSTNYAYYKAACAKSIDSCERACRV